MKNKKSLIAAGAIALIAIAGGTFAYFRYTETFENNFGLAKEEVAFTETFKSPDNWSPCTETTKEFKVTNTGNIAVNARVKFTEGWVKLDASGQPTSQTLPLTVNNENMAVVHFANPSDWVLNADGWYYYQGDIAATNGETSLFIDKVTFNCNAGNDYSSARYTLNLQAQTIQATAAARQAAGWNY